MKWVYFLVAVLLLSSIACLAAEQVSDGDLFDKVLSDASDDVSVTDYRYVLSIATMAILKFFFVNGITYVIFNDYEFYFASALDDAGIGCIAFFMRSMYRNAVLLAYAKRNSNSHETEQDLSKSLDKLTSASEISHGLATDDAFISAVVGVSIVPYQEGWLTVLAFFISFMFGLVESLIVEFGKVYVKLLKAKELSIQVQVPTAFTWGLRLAVNVVSTFVSVGILLHVYKGFIKDAVDASLLQSSGAAEKTATLDTVKKISCVKPGQTSKRAAVSGAVRKVSGVRPTLVKSAKTGVVAPLLMGAPARAFPGLVDKKMDTNPASPGAGVNVQAAEDVKPSSTMSDASSYSASLTSTLLAPTALLVWAFVALIL